ncbi:hypothetical protein N7528_009222 [Penicillium herquei]|nr:hypothetical protein N7528_009222 [Penicillium herquei]
MKTNRFDKDQESQHILPLNDGEGDVMYQGNESATLERTPSSGQQTTSQPLSSLSSQCGPGFSNTFARHNGESFENGFGEISQLDELLLNSRTPSGVENPLNSFSGQPDPVQQVHYDHWQFGHPVPPSNEAFQPPPTEPDPVQQVHYDHWQFGHPVPPSNEACQPPPTEPDPVQQVHYDHWQFGHPVPPSNEAFQPPPTEPDPVQQVHYDHWQFGHPVPPSNEAFQPPPTEPDPVQHI